jgi:hypothetical protein
MGGVSHVTITYQVIAIPDSGFRVEILVVNLNHGESFLSGKVSNKIWSKEALC